jgi:hypothetical protein
MSTPDAEQPSVLSPYLSLREAVRPAIVAFNILAQEQNHAGSLAKEADDLLQATRELLRALGAVHLQRPEAGESLPSVSEPDAGLRAGLLDTYAEAGMMWARVVGTSLTLAETLLDQGKWDTAQRLAEFLDTVGEGAAAQPLRERAATAARRATEKRLSQIHAEMTEDEIATAIKVLEETQNNIIIHDYLLELTQAIWRVIAPKPSPKQGIPYNAIPDVLRDAIRGYTSVTESGAWGRLHDLATIFYKFQAGKERTAPQDG